MSERPRPAESLSDALRRHIRAEGVSLYELAEQTGVARGLLSRFMRGERDIRLETANRIAAYLGLELRRVRKRRKG